MKRRWNSARIAVLVCGLAVGVAAAKTKVVGTEATQNPPEAPARKILVLVVAADANVRSSFEQVIAGELSLRGTRAVASSVSFPELPKDRAAFEAKLTSEGFDAVTVTRLVSKEDKYEWKEGHESYRSDYMGMDCWGGYWYAYSQVFVQGYLESESKVRARTDLWRTSATKGRLVWSGTTESLDPSTIPQAAREVGVAIAKALVKTKLI